MRPALRFGLQLLRLGRHGELLLSLVRGLQLHVRAVHPIGSKWIVGPDGRLAPQPSDVAKKFENKVGHAADYSWLTGQLQYVHADGGLWVLRYASVGEQDKFGGSVILAPTVNMKNFREGDLVSVRGDIVNEARASLFAGGPLYRPSSVDMLERAD